MQPSARITLHWTISRQAAVLTGLRGELERVALALDLPANTVVALDHRAWVLGLWGEALGRYQRLSQHRATTGPPFT